MKVRLLNEQIEMLSFNLLGTDLTIDQGLELLGFNFKEIDDTSLRIIDMVIFKCQACKIWHLAEDLIDDDTCAICVDDFLERGEESYEDQIICSDFGAAVAAATGESASNQSD